ncbi:MAG: dihydrodipicolinate synthase family protein [SAR202 cluster bacterium]|nr:dihydrodipicolinate synthase family protein [SAR202 cluster bacterium]
MAEYSKNEAMDWARENLRGQWSTLMTSFNEDNQINEPGIRADIKHIKSLGTKGIGCTWGMGEFWSLTEQERLKVYDVVSDEGRHDWLIAAHITDTSLKNVINFAGYVQSIGFDLLILAAPYFVTRKEEQVLEFVEDVAANTDLAIMFYNSPQFGIVLDENWLGKVCQISNVVGVKEASFNKDISINTHLNVGNDAIISTPDEWILFTGNEMGFNQQVMFANTSDWRFDKPGSNHYVSFVERAMSGDLDKEYYDKHIKPIKAISDQWWQHVVTNQKGAMPVPLCKYWGELMGMTGGSVRSPLTDMSVTDKNSLKNQLDNLFGQ